MATLSPKKLAQNAQSAIETKLLDVFATKSNVLKVPKANEMRAIMKKLVDDMPADETAPAPEEPHAPPQAPGGHAPAAEQPPTSPPTAEEPHTPPPAPPAPPPASEPAPVPPPGAGLRAVVSDGTVLTEASPRKGDWNFLFRRFKSGAVEGVLELGRVFAGTAANAPVTGWSLYDGDRLVGSATFPRFHWRGRDRIRSAPEPFQRNVADAIGAGLFPRFATTGFKSVALPGGASYTPMGYSALERRMPNTGGRPDIGLYTAWAAQYIASPTPANEATIRAIAEAAGSMPICIRDENTGKPLSIVQYPTMTTADDDRFKGTPKISFADTGWTLETAHFPDVSYPIAVLTGFDGADNDDGLYHVENLQHFVTWMLQGRDPGYRQNAKGIIINLQVRDVAWCYRMLARCAKVTPVAGGPTLLPKQYFLDLLENQRLYFIDTYMRSDFRQQTVFRDICQLGNAPGEVGAPGGTALKFWQQDMLVEVIADIVRLGFTEWLEILDWLLDAAVARLTAGSGWDRGYACEYVDMIRETSTSPICATWAEADALNKRVLGRTPTDGSRIVSANDDYVGELWAALALSAPFSAKAAAPLAWLKPQMAARAITIDQAIAA